MNKRALPAILAAAVTLGLTACGGDDAVVGEPAASPATLTETVAETQTDTVAETEAETEAETPTTTAEESDIDCESLFEELGNGDIEIGEVFFCETGLFVPIRVKDGAPVGGIQEIKVKRGDLVFIEVKVDEPQELHLHGYELEHKATPEQPAVFEFTAELEGIFDIETHLTEAQIGKLVVEP